MIGEGMKNAALSAAFVAELGRSGVRHAVVCPGSRSTPLALALADSHDIRIWLHIDERSAAFFALGMARSLGEPVAVLCSSGTAAANFLPAVVEASLSRIPLLVLTADRPPELRDVGAAQTMDQVRLYGGHVKWFHELPVPEVTAELLRQVRFTAARAVATALAAPRGPVHLNFPTREPLVPAPGETVPALADEIATAGRGEHRPFTAVSTGPALPDAALAALAADLASTERGLIVCGPQDDPALAPAVARLAAALGYPLLADGLSQTRSGPHDRALVIDTFDAFLRDDATCRALAPEVVLRFGAPPTSKPLAQYLARYPASRHLLIDGVAAWRDPAFLTSDVLHADPVAVCDALADRLGAGAASRSEWTATGSTSPRAPAPPSTPNSPPRTTSPRAASSPNSPRSCRTARPSTPGTACRCATSTPFSRRATAPCAASRTGARMASTASTPARSASRRSAPDRSCSSSATSPSSTTSTACSPRSCTTCARRSSSSTTTAAASSPSCRRPPPSRTTASSSSSARRSASTTPPPPPSTVPPSTAPATGPTFRTAVANGIAGDGLSIVEVCTERASNVAQHRAVWKAVSQALAQPARELVGAND
ncbi:MAG: 2-succinyl-5-enolpyruvyl-6-hydroxy-3-cyclohexene-1-carboxylic-acid synthase [Thermomicrobiales bacterium]